MDQLIEIRPGRRINLTIYKSNPLHSTIFMIHGMGGRGYQWREQIAHLKNRYTLVVPDLLGQGNSERPQSQHENLYGFEELSLDLQALFEEYSTDTNYIFGHSYGGVFATFLARAYPARVQKLALIAPVNCQPFKSIPLVYYLPVSLLELLRRPLDKAFEKIAFAPSDGPDLLKIERQGRDLNSMFVIKSLLQGMKSIPWLPVNQMELPSLIISGRLDRLIPAETVKAFYTRLPQHQYHMIEDAAHMVHLEKSREVNQLLDDFLYC